VLRIERARSLKSEFNFLRAGVPEHVAMGISGNNTQAVFERYHIVSAPDLKGAAQKLEAQLAGEFGDNFAFEAGSGLSRKN